MGTTVDHYVMIGVDVGGRPEFGPDWRDAHHDEVSPRGKEVGDIAAVYDCMASKYHIFGRIISVARGDEWGGFETARYDHLMLAAEIDEVKAILTNRFGITDVPKLFIFSDYH